MSGELTAVIIVATVFTSLVIVVRTMVDHRLRRQLIEKGMVDENVKFLKATSTAESLPSSLKWGMVSIAVGVAILIGQYFPYSFHEEATISAMFIMGGAALILYYFMAKRMAEENEGQDEN